jgi:hypothetical protein
MSSKCVNDVTLFKSSVTSLLLTERNFVQTKIKRDYKCTVQQYCKSEIKIQENNNYENSFQNLLFYDG